jgi:hypothetical protein
MVDTALRGYRWGKVYVGYYKVLSDIDQERRAGRAA